jgi:hypothetical protein
MPLPGVAGAVGISSDRDLLYQQLSADYLLGDTLVIHGTDAAALARLEASSDPTTRQLARARAVLQELSNKMVDAGSNTQAAADIGRLKAELGIFIVQAIDEEGRRPDKAAERAIKILNSDVINRMFDRKTIAAEVAAAAIAVIDRTRQALRDDYRKSHSGGPRLDSRAFRAEFKVSNANMGVIALRNGTGRDLHRCLVATHMAVDEKKADAFERSRTEIDPNFAALSAMMGLDLTAAKECDRAIAAFARIDKGTINYVPLWKSGVSIEFSLAMPDVIAITAGAVDTWVGCDEGEAECKLDLKAIKAKLPSQPANNQPAKRSTGRN